MPSTDTVTSFYSFVALTAIKSAEVNNNFSIFRGHICPVDPTATALVNKGYDLGSATYRWRYMYGKRSPEVLSTSGSMTLGYTNDVVLFNTTAATLTATLPTIVGMTGMSWTLKNIGTGGKTLLVDGNGTETVDNTLTVNLVDLESTTIISDGSNLWSI